MKRIELSKIVVKDGEILYEVRQDNGLNLLKQDTVELFVRLHCNGNAHIDLGRVPQSVLAVPISLYLLPITYFYEVELVLPLMDKMLYERLPDIYSAYSKIYGPFKNEWRGRLTVANIVDTPVSEDGKYDKVVFFSGGVDACSAGINNPGRKTLLVSIPDIESQAKNEGPLREEKFSLIRRFAKVVESEWVLISNNFNVALFRDYEIKKYLRDEKGLSSTAFKFDGWGGIKYMANMCSVAPLAYALGVKNLIMGSTFEPIEENQSLNSDGASPLLSGAMAFAGIRFGEQDELFTRRSAKVCKIIEWCKSRNRRVKLWTCFKDGALQCGICNKCVRTQLNILCASENPKDWGFDKFDEGGFSRFIKSYNYSESPCWLWDIVDAIDSNRVYPYCNGMLHWLKRMGYKEYLRRADVWRSRRNRFSWKILFVGRYPHYLRCLVEKVVKLPRARN